MFFSLGLIGFDQTIQGPMPMQDRTVSNNSKRSFKTCVNCKKMNEELFLFYVLISVDLVCI